MSPHKDADESLGPGQSHTGPHKTLVVVRHAPSEAIKARARVAISIGAEIALIENGVYWTLDQIRSIRADHGPVFVARGDLEARTAQSGFEPIEYSDLLDRIAESDNIIVV